jgi:hypothetical protein
VPLGATNIQLNLIARGYYTFIGGQEDTVQIYLSFEHVGMEPCTAHREDTRKYTGYLTVGRNCTIPGPFLESEWINITAIATSNRGAYSKHTKTVKIWVGDDRIDDGNASTVIIVAVSIGVAVVLAGVTAFLCFKKQQKRKYRKLLETQSLQTS